MKRGSSGWKRTALCTALAAVVSPAAAADPDELRRPSSELTLGLGMLSADAPRLGQYSGMKDQGLYGLLGLDFVRRDDATGTWLMARGRDLGLDSRSLSIQYLRQGDWGVSAEYDQIPRFDPLIARTGLAGIGNPTVTINGQPVRDVQLQTQRQRISFGGSKLFSGGFDVQLRFVNEDKVGERVFGRGTPGAMEFLAEPIDSTTRQLETTIGYTSERLQLTAGYYGTTYENYNTRLDIIGGNAALAAGAGAFTPIALPPSNQAHQLYLAGGYNFTRTLRTNFKFAYTMAKQDDTFILPTTAAVGRRDLGGRVDVGLMQVGLTAQPLPRLSLNANFRHENRNDKTPIASYFAVPAGTTTGENEPRSIRTTAGKLEASYALPAGFRLTGGVDYEEKRRNSSLVRVVSNRDTTEETSYKAELRRSIAENLTGALGYVHSDRGGSPFQATTVVGGGIGSNLIAPIHLADRTRDKVKATLNWEATEALSLQFLLENARDDYQGQRTAAQLGPRTGGADNYGVDAAYVINPRWTLTAWAQRNDTRAEQATQAGATQWKADLRNLGSAIGAGVRGKPLERLELGADLQHSDITDHYRMQTITGAAVNSLPDITTKLTTLSAFARYALDKNLSIRVQYVYDAWKSDDWTWTNFAYGPTDTTRLVPDLNQAVHFIGVSAQYKF